jgi:hypothetical protein
VTTKRRPINRPPRSQFTAAALAAFRKLQALEKSCTCEPINWNGEYWKHERCPACTAWWVQHKIIHRELKLGVLQWPCVERPGADNPYPEGSEAAALDKPDLQAQALYAALEQACRASS